jgi:pimeloyl-ACP methyl ester carboxylesterase
MSQLRTASIGRFSRGTIAAIAGAIALQCFVPARVDAQRGAGPSGPIQSDRFRTVYVRLGGSDEGLLYEPTSQGPNARIAIVNSHPNGNNFNAPMGRELAARGYRVLMVNHHGEEESPDVYAPGISRGIQYVRTLAGVQRVVVLGHSGGGHLMAFYTNIAEHGPAGCQGPDKIYPCKGTGLNGLAKPDGLVLLDSTLGAFHQMSSIDPAVEGKSRTSALDMFAASNGYDADAKRGTYSPAFAKTFYAAQAARNAKIVDTAVARLHAIEQGKGQFTDDEPLVIPGMGVNAAGARLYQPDTSFAARTKKPHWLLKADGTQPEVIVPSVRPASGVQFAGELGTLGVMTQNTTVRRYLALSAIRTAPDYAITADDIVGVNWKSATTSTPGNAEGISVPALVMVMSCHYLVVPGEIIFDHLASTDKTYAAVEGAVHGFTPCKPEYGDTVKRVFDYVDGWLGKAGRF